jgi:SPP1 family predicted phage head-tail adaptor
MPSFKPSIANPRAISLDHSCDLISIVTTKDKLGQFIKDELLTQVFCAELSITRSEFNSAGQMGKKAQKLIIVDGDSYDNQSLLEYEGVKYSIYKSFRRVDGLTELYTETKAGD